MESLVSMDKQHRMAGNLVANEQISSESLMQTGDSSGASDLIRWTTLPDTAVIKIFSFLQYKQRLFAASTCSNWWRIFHEVQLWRSLNIELASEPALVEATELVRFHGRHVRCLTVDSCCGSSSVKVQRQMTLLLRFLKIRKSPLTTLRFRNFRLDNYWGFGAMRARLANSLICFMRRQKCLENVDLSLNGLELSRGLTLLQTMSHSSGHSIKKINITDYFHGVSMLHNVETFAAIMTNFSCLCDLSTNYGCITNYFLEKLTESNKSLKNLSIRVRCNDHLNHRVHSATWRNLTKVHPNLRVNFNFEGLFRYGVRPSILVDGIPLYRLEILSGHLFVMMDGPSLLAHVAETFEKTLVECRLQFDNVVMSLDRAMEHLIRQCRGLRSFEVVTQVSTDFVANICELRRRKEVLLEKFHVTCWNTSMTTQRDVTRIREHYITMINGERLDYAFDTAVGVMED